MLRRFLDTNGDNKVDQWCYFKDGIEIYRDIDGNFNNKADQYRWLGTAGTRWGLDDDENGRIDSWKVISAEEVTAEVVAALRDRDAARFQRLLLTADELKSLGLSDKQASRAERQRSPPPTKPFADVAKQQKIVTAKSEWVHFGASKPGVVPAGTDGSTKDSIVYDNVDRRRRDRRRKHGQLVIGTLIKIGDTWQAVRPAQEPGRRSSRPPSGGYFFQAVVQRPAGYRNAAPAGNVSAEMKKLVDDLEQLDKQLAAATSRAEQARLNADRADLLDKIIAVAPAEDRDLWIRQYAETVAAAIQSGAFPDGVRAAGVAADAGLQAARRPTSWFPMSSSGMMTAEVQPRPAGQGRRLREDQHAVSGTTWSNSSRTIPPAPTPPRPCCSSPSAPSSPAKTKDAVELVRPDRHRLPQIATWPRRPPAPSAAWNRSASRSRSKARRSTAARSTWPRPRTRSCSIHYWATWCEPCKQDLDTIKSLQAKYGKEAFIRSASTSTTIAKDATTFLRAANRSPGRSSMKQGGLDSAPGHGAGHPHAAHDDPRRQGRQSHQPQHPRRRARRRAEEAAAVVSWERRLACHALAFELVPMFRVANATPDASRPRCQVVRLKTPRFPAFQSRGRWHTPSPKNIVFIKKNTNYPRFDTRCDTL